MIIPLIQTLQLIVNPTKFLDEAQPEEKAKLPYLTAICQEALRLHPIALICTPRQVKNTVEIAGQKFTSGTVLVPCIHLAHRRPETYPEAEKFQPERFVNRKFSPFEYLPFGGGYRGCIGAAFSMYELKLIVATILSRFDLALAEHSPLHSVRRGITIVPSGGVAMIIVQIKNKVSGKIALNSSKK